MRGKLCDRGAGGAAGVVQVPILGLDIVQYGTIQYNTVLLVLLFKSTNTKSNPSKYKSQISQIQLSIYWKVN